jgi:hypothetical protein
LDNDTRVVEHLKKHRWTAKTLRLQAVPDRTTVGRWWRRYLNLLEQTFVKIANILQLAVPTKIAVVDSTPLVDLYDMEAQWGYTSRGKFRGFKLHAAVNQLGLPLRALVMPGNRFDGSFLPRLIDDLEADFVLADGAYNSKRDFKAVKAINAKPVIADNPRKKGKSRKIESDVLLRSKRYLVDRFDGLVKCEVLDGCWLWPRGLVKKTSMVMAGLISMAASAVDALVEGEKSLRKVSKYWD